MSNFVAISAKLKTVIAGVQQASSAAFVDVLENPTGQFNGFPSATIVPTDVSSIYATVNQNRRSYGFEVALFISIGNTGDVATAFAQMRVLADSVLDALEQTIDLGGIVNYLIPVPMRWSIEASDSGDVLVAPIQITAEKDVVLF